jgi:signal transduction histidine kinase/CheY-like chemotaxis protein
MESLFDLFGNGRGFQPHGYCLLWYPGLLWTHVLADALIAAAYFSIPVAIVRFVTKRQDIAFSWIFWLFALFIIACGTTHLMNIWTLWYPSYGWEAVIKVITAIASVGTAIVLWPLVPRALAIPSPLQLRQANEELARRVAERDSALERLRHEVAERERAEAALNQAQKMEAVGQLTGGIAHDFNNLLQAVTGMLGLIVRHPGDEQRVARWADQGLKAAERGARLTSQLLAFSRVQKLDLKPVPLCATINGMRDLLSRTLGHHVEIVTDLPQDEVSVIADTTQLELALLNLALNARDAMTEGGRVTIGVQPGPPTPEHPGGAIDVRVQDTGTGMPADVVERAFEPFFTTKGVGKGTGLGLSMVYGVARQSGGSAHIDSTPGEGTTVTIRLRRADAVAAVETPAGDTGDAAGHGETILLVDDDEAVRTSLAEGLGALGYRVLAAEDGVTALALLQRERPAAAVFDFAMPGMTGAELARTVRPLRPEMPILFASGFADSDALVAAVGPDAPVLRKPFTIEELAARLGELLPREQWSSD